MYFCFITNKVKYFKPVLWHHHYTLITMNRYEKHLNAPSWDSKNQMCPFEVCLLSLCFYRCKVCPLTFFSKSDMQIHSKTHTEAKAHKCPHCTKSFANTSYLAQHLRIHLGVKPYRCSYCEKCFRQLSHLQQHTRSDLVAHSVWLLPSSAKAAHVWTCCSPCLGWA